MFVYFMCINEYGSLSSSNAPMPKTKYTYNVKIYAKFVFQQKVQTLKYDAEITIPNKYLDSSFYNFYELSWNR